jgi:hypothetical protein
MAITFSRRAIVATAFVAATLAVGTLVILKLTTADEDRNPIRVKNNKLRIETEDKDAKWKKPNAAQPWRLDGGGRLTVQNYFVTAFGALPETACTPSLKGTSVDIQFKDTSSGAAHTLTFSLQLSGSKIEPALATDAGTTLRENNEKKVRKLSIENDPDMTITQMTVSDGGTPVGTCNFSGDRRVLIELCMHGCE